MTRKHLAWLLIPLAAVLLASLRGPVPAREPELAPDLKKALATLRSAETYDDEAVGEAGEKSETYLAYEVLRDRAPPRVLVLLTDDENPILRCYALRALTEKHPTADVFAILWRHLDDRAEVETFRGCLVGGEKVADVMIGDVRPRMSADQGRRLAERILRAGSDLEERRRLLLDDRVPEQLLPLVREIAKSGDDDALVALARHRVPEDLDLLKTRVSAADPVRSFSVLEAASHFPHPDLLPALEALAPKVRTALREKPPGRLRFYFRAVASQGGGRAVALLTDLLETPELPEYKLEVFARILFEAIRESRDPAFEPLFRTLWTAHGRLDAEVARRLHGRDPAWVLARTEEDLRKNVNRLPEDAVGALLEILASADRARAIRLIAPALPHADVHRFGVLARMSSRLGDEALIEPLFHAYETRTNPHSYLAAARALLAFDREEIDERLEKGVKANPALGKGWGGKRLTKLLAEKPRREK